MTQLPIEQYYSRVQLFQKNIKDKLQQLQQKELLNIYKTKATQTFNQSQCIVNTSKNDRILPTEMVQMLKEDLFKKLAELQANKDINTSNGNSMHQKQGTEVYKQNSSQIQPRDVDKQFQKLAIINQDLSLNNEMLQQQLQKKQQIIENLKEKMLAIKKQKTQQIKGLQHKLSQFEAQMEDLRQQIMQNSINSRKSEDEYLKKQHQIQELKLKSVNISQMHQQELKKIKKQNEQLVKKYQQIQKNDKKRIEDILSEFQQLTLEKKQLVEKYEAIEQQIAHFKEKFVSMQKDVEKKDLQLQKWQSQNRISHQNHQITIEQQKQLINKLEKQIQKLKDSNNQQVSRIQAQSQAAKALIEKINLLENNLNTNEKKLQYSEEQIKKHNQNEQQLKKKIQTITQEVNTLKEKKLSVEESIRLLQLENNNLKENLSGGQKTLSLVSKQKTEISNKCQQFIKNSQRLQQQIIKAKSDIKKLQEQNKNLKEEIYKLKTDNNELQEYRRKAMEENNQIRQLIQRQKQINQQMLRQNAKWKEQNFQLQEQKKKVQQQITQKTEKVDQLQKQIQNYILIASQEEPKIKKYQQNLDELTKQLQKANINIVQLQQKVKDQMQEADIFKEQTQKEKQMLNNKIKYLQSKELYSSSLTNNSNNSSHKKINEMSEQQKKSQVIKVKQQLQQKSKNMSLLERQIEFLKKQRQLHQNSLSLIEEQKALMQIIRQQRTALAEELRLVKEANQILMDTQRKLKDQNQTLHLQKKQSEQAIENITKNSVSLDSFNKLQQQLDIQRQGIRDKQQKYIQKLKKLTQNLQQQQGIKTKLEQQSKELIQNLQKLKLALSERQQALNQCVNMKSNLAKQNSTFKQNSQKMKVKIQTLTKKIEETQKINSQILGLNKIYKQQQDKYKKTIKNFQEKMSQNQSIKDNLSMQISMLNANFENLKAHKYPTQEYQSIHQLTEKLEKSKKLVSKQELQIQTLKEDLHSHQQKIQYIQQQKSRLKSEILKQSEMVTNLQHQIKQQKQRNKNLQSRNQALHQKNKQQELQILNKQKDIREHQEKYILLENQLSCLKSQLSKHLTKNISKSVQSHEVQTIMDNYAVSLKFLQHDSDHNTQKRKIYSEKLTQGKKKQVNDFVDEDKFRQHRSQSRSESVKQLNQKVQFKKVPSLQVIDQQSTEAKKFMKKTSFSSQPNNPINRVNEQQFKPQIPSEPNFLKRGSSSIREGSQSNYHNQGFIQLQSQKMDIIAEKDQHIFSNSIIESQQKNQQNSSVLLGQGTGNANSHAKDYEPSSKGKLFLSMSQQNRHLRDQNHHLHTQLSKLSVKLLQIQFYSKKWKQLKTQRQKAVNLLSCVKVKEKLQNLIHQKDNILATQQQLNGPLTSLINNLQSIIKETFSWVNLLLALGSISYPKINQYQPIYQHDYGKRMTDKITKIHFVNEKSIYSEGNTPRKGIEKDFNSPFEFQMQQREQAYCPQNKKPLKQLFRQNDKSQISSVKQHSQNSGSMNSKSDLLNYLMTINRSPDIYDQYQSAQKKIQPNQQELFSVKATKNQQQLLKSQLQKLEKILKDTNEQTFKAFQILRNFYKKKIERLKNDFNIALLRIIDKKQDQQKQAKTKQQAKKLLSPNSLQSNNKKQRMRSEDGSNIIPESLNCMLQIENLKKKISDNQTKIAELALLVQQKNALLLECQKKLNEQKAVRQKLQESLQKEKTISKDLKETKNRIENQFYQFMMKLPTKKGKENDNLQKQQQLQTNKSQNKQVIAEKIQQKTSPNTQVLEIGSRLYEIIENIPTRQQFTIMYEPMNRKQVQQIIDQLANFTKNYERLEKENIQRQKAIIENYNKVLSQLIIINNMNQTTFLDLINKIFYGNFSNECKPLFEFAKQFSNYGYLQQQLEYSHKAKSANDQLKTPTKEQKKSYSGIEHSLNSKETQLQLALALSDYKDKNKILEFQNKRLVKQNAFLSQQIDNYKKLKKKLSKANLQNQSNQDKLIQQNEEFYDFKDQQIYCNTDLKDQKIKQLQESLEHYKQLCVNYENKLKNKRKEQIIHRNM